MALPEERNRREYQLKVIIPLYRASVTGDLKAARSILDSPGDLVRYTNENMETPLHVAVASNSTKFVSYLVNMMNAEDLELRNKEGNTAFSLAAIAGNVGMAKIMVEKNPRLPTIPDHDDKMPLYLAAFHGKHDMVTYLYYQNRRMTGDGCWTNDRKDEILLKCIEADFFDVGLRMLIDHAELPQDNNLGDVLQTLAQKPEAFHCRSIQSSVKETVESYGIWCVFFFFINLLPGVLAFIRNLVKGRAFKERNATTLLKLLLGRLMEKPKNTIDDILKGHSLCGTYPSHVVFVATRMNNSNFLAELIREYPDVILMNNDDGQSIFHISVSHRYHDIFNLIYEIGTMKHIIATMKDQQGNNILHLAGMNPEKNPYGDFLAAPYKLQSELLWYKKVCAVVPPPCRIVKNAAGKTPYEIFEENHKDLVSQGENWIKKTINQCMVVATLVASVAFSNGISIPGGYDQDEGFPLLITDNDFIVFIIFDALSFFFSAISIIIFLSISSFQHTPKAFRVFLPLQLSLGHATLMASVLCLITAFSRNLYSMYRHASKNMDTLIHIFEDLGYVFIVLTGLGYIAVSGSTYLQNTDLRELILSFILRKKRKLY